MAQVSLVLCAGTKIRCSWCSAVVLTIKNQMSEADRTNVRDMVPGQNVLLSVGQLVRCGRCRNPLMQDDFMKAAVEVIELGDAFLREKIAQARVVK